MQKVFGFFIFKILCLCMEYLAAVFEKKYGFVNYFFPADWNR